jgi:hypothetical protein
MKPKRKELWHEPMFFDDSLMPNLTVFDRVEDRHFRSRLVQANGDPILYVKPSTKQSFIGFIEPSWAADEEEADEEDMGHFDPEDEI